MNTKRLLQLSLELLSQIICLQNLNVVHGDIKPANIAVKVNASGDLEVKLIDFDNIVEIKRDTEEGAGGDGGGSLYRVNVRVITPWHDIDRKGSRIVTGISQFIKQLSIDKNQFIKYFLGINDQVLFTIGLNAYYNIPTTFGELVLTPVYDPPIKDKKMITGSLDYLHIIDLCSWSYVVAYAIQNCLHQKVNTRDRNGGIFVCNVLVAIVMNIMIPNHNIPRDPPVDCFGRIINKDYCDKVVNGISVLLQLLDESYVDNGVYTHSKTKLFFDLIQMCSTADELYRRFKDINDKNLKFYNKNYKIEDEGGKTVKDAFQTITSHIHGVSAEAEAGLGGSYTRKNKKKNSKRILLKGKMKSRKLRMKKKKKTLRS